MPNRLATPFLAALLSSVATLAPAADPQDVANRLKEITSGQGYDLSWSAVEGTDSSAILRGVVARIGESPAASLGDIVIEGIEDGEDGNLVAETVEIPGYSFTLEDITYAVDGISMTGVVLPPIGSTDLIAVAGFYETAEVSSVTVDRAGTRILTMSGISSELELDDDGKGYSFYGEAETFDADMAGIDDPRTLAILTALNLTKPKGSMEISGSFSLSTGELRVDQADFVIAGAGTLRLAIAMGGYTEDFIKGARELQRAQSDGPAEPDGAQGMAMLGLMQQLSLIGASVRYDDEDLAGRALDMAAGMQGMRRSDMVGLARMMLPGLLDQYVPAEFAREVSGEVAKFIEKPDSLEVRAAPANPVPFAVLGMGILSPQGLPGQLALRVTANTAAE